MSSDPKDSIDARLARLQDALSTPRSGARPPAPEPRPQSLVPAAGLAGAASLCLVLAFATGQWWLLGLVALFAAGAGLASARRLGAELHALERGLPSRSGLAAHVGMGADVAGDAIVEPGAVVEMGASIGARAVVRAGAVVRMGADVGEGAVVERDAVVSWGATVHANAIVGEGASVGAGADVKEGARVPAGASLSPGSTWQGGAGAATRLPEPAPVDPRLARVELACARLAAELRTAPASVREFVGAGEDTVAALRETCRGLLSREAALRAEASAEALARLDAERGVLEQRIDKSADALVRRSLTGALDAIAAQRQHRQRLAQEAERLDAELTRLTLMLEGMGAQLVRVRSTTGGAADAELGQSLEQLHDEIDAIARALEEVSAPALVSPVVDVGGEGVQAADPTRVRGS